MSPTTMSDRDLIENLFTIMPPANDSERVKRDQLTSAYKSVAQLVINNVPEGHDRLQALDHLRESWHQSIDGLAVGGAGFKQ